MQNLKRHGVIIMMLTILLSLGLTACGVAQASDEEIEARWQTSAHADKEARSFSHWNDREPPEIPINCAKCHSTHGYRDFLGINPDTTTGQVDNPASIGSTIECEACHNTAAHKKDTVVMPSGLKVTGLGTEANCMECHQGRASTNSINEAVAGQTADSVNTELSLPNIHNNPVGATQYGTEAKGGFEYDGRSYVGQYKHVVQFGTCQACHDPHTLQVQLEKCSACHLGVETAADLPHIRTNNIDYDGDGNISEGMAGEIETIQERLLFAMNVYAAKTEGVDRIVFDGRFQNEAGDSYATWTPRLLQAAYNYQFSAKDTGSYAHNNQYIIQLLYDSLNDLGAGTDGLTRPEN
ncbi:MAG: polyheme membrane-associated cytochrome C [Chloroflexi bacterium]|nr:polyheme membrane-associated cytochrome C [Chloroflexota bacterium]